MSKRQYVTFVFFRWIWRCLNCDFWCGRNKYEEGSFWCALENQYCSWAAFTISVCRSVKVSANKFASHSGFQLWKKPKSRKYKSTFCTTKCQWFQKNTKAQRPPMLICFRSQCWKERKKYLLSSAFWHWQSKYGRQGFHKKFYLFWWKLF